MYTTTKQAEMGPITSQLYINHTYDLMRQSYAQSRVFDSKVTDNMNVVATILEDLAKLSQTNLSTISVKSRLRSMRSVHKFF